MGLGLTLKSCRPPPTTQYNLYCCIVGPLLKYVSNGGYGRAGLRLSLYIVRQGRGPGREKSHHDPQGGGSQGRRHRPDQSQGKG